jgi:serine protease inhibitor
MEIAAGTTAAILHGKSRMRYGKKQVRVDRAFLFAIQHRPSGPCLFLGRILDPR